MCQKARTKEEDIKAVLEAELCVIPDRRHAVLLALRAIAGLSQDMGVCESVSEFAAMAMELT